jgi:LmbE family N-acetylglucosaminyl deacetylase
MPLTVLGVFAHPDDETFGPGGTIARMAAEGHRVHILCATRGEAGSIGVSASLGRSQLAALRYQEMLAACRVLGTEPPRILTFPDSGLARLERVTLLRPVVRAIREIRPKLLLSFHADGISGHSDHRTMTARTLEAFEAAADPGRWPDLGPPHAADRAWTYAVPESQARRITARQIHAVADDALDASIDTQAYVGVKQRAVAAHASQKPFIDWLEQHLGGLEEYWAREGFTLAAARTPLPPGEPRPVGDLAAGL